MPALAHLWLQTIIIILGCHDIRHNDIEHNDTRENYIQQNDTWHASIECRYAECREYLNGMLSVIMLNIVMLGS
jgi:hypothetical protein